jgi:hypothetical protein
VGSIPPGAWLSVVSVVCCQVEVSATSCRRQKHTNKQTNIPTHYIYVGKDVRIRGYFSRPEGVREQKKFWVTLVWGTNTSGGQKPVQLLHNYHMNHPGTELWPSLRELGDCRMETPALTCAKLLIQIVNAECTSRIHVTLDTELNYF